MLRFTRAFALFIALLAPSFPATIHAEPFSDREFLRLAKMLEKQSRTPAAYELLDRIFRLSTGISDPGRLDTLYQKLLSQRRLPPLFASHLRWYRAWYKAARGDLAFQHRVLKELGFAFDWWIIGPFDNLGQSTLKGSSGIEETLKRGLDLKRSFPGKSHPVSWRHIDGIGLQGPVNLQRYFSRVKEVLAYAATAVYSPKAQWVALRTGSSDGLAVYVHGQRVHLAAVQRRGYMDQEVTAIHLQKGWNPILVKVGNVKRQWGFFLRLTRLDGGPIPEIRFSSKPQHIQLPRREQPKKPTRMALAHPLNDARRLLSAARSTTAKRQATLLLADLLRLFHPFDMTQPLDRPLYTKLVQADRKNLRAWIGLALSNWDDDNGRRHALLNALRVAGKTSTAAIPIMIQLARYYTRRRLPEKARHYYRLVLKKDPLNLPATIAMATYFRILDLPQKSLMMLSGLRKTYSNQPLLLLAIADIHYRLNDRTRALDFYNRIAKSFPLDATSRRRSIRLHLDAMELEPCLKRYRELQRILPDEVSIALAHSQLLMENRRQAEAIKLLTDLRKRQPTNPDLLERLGRHYHRINRSKLAFKFWSLAMTYHPQNTALKRYAAFLKRNRPLAARYTIPFKKVLSQPVGPQLRTASAVYLLDQEVTRMKPNGLSDRFRQYVVKIQSNKQRDRLIHQRFYYVPGQQSFELLTTDLHRKSGDVLQPTSVHRYRPYGKIGGVYQNIVVVTVSFNNLEVGDVIHIRYRRDDISRENMFGTFFGTVVRFQSTVPVRLKKYILEVPHKRKIYTHSKGVPAPQIRRTKTHRIYTWKATTIPEIVAERRMPGFPEIGKYINISTYKDWATLSKWYHRLVRYQFVLNDALKQLVAKLVDGVSDKRERIRRIHNWVVQNTRYVGIEFGIHSFKPYHVTQVYKRKYGDCKDKATLMIAMLREAGVEASFVMIRTRTRGRLHPYPATLWAFNHAIAYVPRYNLYLDGTAEFSGTDELPYQDQGAMAVVIDKDGNGRLVTTPIFGPKKTLWTLDAEINLEKNKSSLVTGRQTISGLMASIFRRKYQVVSDRKSRLERAMGAQFPGARVLSASFSKLTELEKPIQVNYKAKLPNLLESDSRGYRVPLVLYPLQLTRQYASSSSREYDLVLHFAWQEKATVRWLLPTGYRPLKPIGNLSTTSRFGQFKLHYSYAAGKLTVRSHFSMNKHRISTKEYPDFRRFCLQVDKLVERKLQLVKQ